jgi:diguanylate cyclase (GGDEF)-like protein
MTSREEAAAGLNLFGTILAKFGLKIRESKRPWPDRMATYVLIGNHDLNPGPGTDLVFPDEFLSDLTNTKDHKEAAESYAQALSSRMRCGIENQYFCKSGVPVGLEIHWPIKSAFTHDMRHVAWLMVAATNELAGTSAMCALQFNTFEFPSPSPLQRAEQIANRIREAVDEGIVQFTPGEAGSSHGQVIEQTQTAERPQASEEEVERFLVGKAYNLGFRATHSPRPIWIPDPWDATYLGTTTRVLSQAAHILRAKKLLTISEDYASPSDKLIADGPSELPGRSRPRQKLSHSTPADKARFESHIADELKRGTDLALIFVDLDHFKKVNDTYGHPAGDACLDKAIQAMEAAIGSKGTLYRWGGDEFAVCLPDFSTDEAAATAERIRRSIESSKAGGAIAITASIGVCATDQTTTASAADFTDTADKAMYSSKEAGRNRVTVAYKAGFTLTSPKPQRRPL